jgi:hypothetical protein
LPTLPALTARGPLKALTPLAATLGALGAFNAGSLGKSAEHRQPQKQKRPRTSVELGSRALFAASSCVLLAIGRWARRGRPRCGPSHFYEQPERI